MWEQIRANRLRSAMLISLMGVVLVLLGYCGGEMILSGGGGLIGLIVAAVVLLVQLGIYFGGAQSLVLGEAASVNTPLVALKKAMMKTLRRKSK